ncbi:MAG: hypothetical protein OXI81_10525 [Paracoccaceae bacterium]|nr:hypothetical protein [Paracoccaceae bacterium]MDE2911718.1 hypothetical protein [Paracoccaceae bacterium]
MHVSTPIADMEINLDRFVVENGTLVVTNSGNDAMPARAVIEPRDVRRLLGAFLRPRVAWYFLTCLVRSDGDGQSAGGGQDDDHPSPVSW